MNHYLKLSRILIALFLVTTIKASAQVEKPVTLNHIAVYIFNLQKSTDFYKDIIGLNVIPEPFHDGKHTWFKVAEHSQLHLIQGAKSVTEHDKDAHLCFTVSSMENFIAKLNKNNIWFEDWTGNHNKITKRPDGIQQIYFKDPDGYWIEINNDTY